MTDIKIIKYQDSLNHFRKQLTEIIEEKKKIASSYQNYLKANPHKAKKKELEKAYERTVQTILAIVEHGFEEFDESTVPNIRRKINGQKKNEQKN